MITMDIQEFEKWGKYIVEWIIQYYRNIEEYPVKPNVSPKEILARLPENPPLRGEDFQGIFNDFNEMIMPGVTHWQHPRFFAYFPANTSFPSILGEFLTSAIASQCMSWLTSPAATELEERVMDWLRQMIGISDEFVGVIQDTASTSTLVSLLTAREKYSKYSINESGFENVKFTVYCSYEAHSSIEKAVKIAGIGRKNLKKIPVGDNYAMRVDLLEKQIEFDIQSGLQPLCVVGALGTTGSTAIDPLGEIGEVAKRYGLWYHIDGAMVGSALMLPEFVKLREWINSADTFVFNPHKWLFTNFDCSAYFVKDKEALIKTFEITPEYLKTDIDKQVNNYRDWGIQLGRRFRALKLWFVIRAFGVEGLKEKLSSHIEWAKLLEKEMRADGRFEILAPVNFNTICFRCKFRGKTDEELEILNKKLLDAINDSGIAFFSHTKLNGKFAIRFSIGQTNTKWQHIYQTWQFIQSKTSEIIENAEKEKI